MKIREGFVSNSSTTSFCIFGAKVKRVSDNDEYDYDVLEEKAESVNLDMETDYDEDNYYIGIAAQNLPMDKTLNEMMKIISEKIDKLGLKHEKITWHQDAWYDG